MRLTSKTLVLFAGAGTAILFVVMVVHVFRLSGESGVTFAPYSTYRSDPLGAMALYNALDALPETHVERFIQEFDELPEGKGRTLVITGAGVGPDPVPILDSVEAFAATGGRVIIAFFPIHNDASLEALDDFLDERDHVDKDDTPGDTNPLEIDKPDGSAPSDASQTQDPGSPSTPPVVVAPPTAPNKERADGDGEGEPDDEIDFGPPLEDISERWSFDYGFEKPGKITRQTRLDDLLPIQSMLEGRSGLYFIPADDKWHPVYGKVQPQGEPGWVGVMERRIGSGSVVLCSDAYFMSNEALQAGRDPEFLAWVLGNNSTILFSEAHLGTQQQDRIMTLMRRYRLHGVLFSLALISVLFVWHHATTLIPRREQMERAMPSTQTERSHQDGLDNLLARFIPQSELLDTCVREWSQQFHNDPKAQSIQHIQNVKTQGLRRTENEAELVGAFNEIAREIHHK